MRRFLLSVTTLGLCGLIIGCQTLSESSDYDCCDGSCGGSEVMAGPQGAPVMPPAGAESIKEMPKVDDAPQPKGKLENAPAPLPVKPRLESESAPLPSGPGLEIK